MSSNYSVTVGVASSADRWGAVRSTLAAAVHQSCPTWLAAEAEDIVQESMIRLLHIVESREGNPDPGSLYLWKVAYSVTVDEIRRQRRRHEVPLGNGLPRAVDGGHGSSPEELAAGGEVGRGILDCLAGLAENRRQAVRLRLLGHTVGEVASLMGWPYKKTENLVYRGLEDLRRCLRRKDLQR